MYALLKQSGSSVRALFAQMGISVDELNTKLSQEIEKLFKVEGVGGDVQLSNNMVSLINLCDKYAQKRKDKYISSELFVLVACEDKGPLGSVFKALNITATKVETAIRGDSRWSKS